SGVGLNPGRPATEERIAGRSCGLVRAVGPSRWLGLGVTAQLVGHVRHASVASASMCRTGSFPATPVATSTRLDDVQVWDHQLGGVTCEAKGLGRRALSW